MAHIKKLLVLFSLSCFASTFCLADNIHGFYAGAGLSAINNDEHSSFSSQDLWVGEIIGGYKYNDSLGLELRYGSGITVHSEKTYTFVNNEDIVTENDLLKIDRYAAIYYRIESINETGRLYGLLGYTDINLETEGISQSVSDFSWGLGLGFFMTPQWNLNFEYRHLADINKVKLTTITASIDYRF